MDGLDELFSECDDFELCDSLTVIIDDTIGPDDELVSIPQPCRTIALVWNSHGVICNGGFEYLFESTGYGDAGFVDTAASYSLIGAENSYKAFCDALALFPKNSPPSDTDERVRLYQQHPEKIRDAIAVRFFKESDKVKEKLAAFIREHQEQIRACIATMKSSR